MSTYNQILDVAHKYIQKVGFNAFSYSDLADEIGIKTASIHYHFPSKMNLGIAYCHFKLNQLLNLEILINAQDSIEAKLFKYGDAFISCAEKNEMCGIHSMFTDIDSFSEPLQKAVSELVECELRILENIFKDELHGSIPTRNRVTPKQLALIVNATIKGALLMNRISKNDLYMESMEAVIQLIQLKYKQ